MEKREEEKAVEAKPKLSKAEQALEDRKQAQLQEQEEIENLITNKAVTFGDIEKLSYLQINQVSNKYGEDEFNPHDLLGAQDDGSDNSDDEILNRFKVKTNQAQLSGS